MCDTSWWISAPIIAESGWVPHSWERKLFCWHIDGMFYCCIVYLEVSSNYGIGCWLSVGDWTGMLRFRTLRHWTQLSLVFLNTNLTSPPFGPTSSRLPAYDKIVGRRRPSWTGFFCKPLLTMWIQPVISCLGKKSISVWKDKGRRRLRKWVRFYWKRIVIIDQTITLHRYPSLLSLKFIVP